MSGVIFTYTIVLILVCFAAAMLAVAAYAVSHKRSLLPRAAFFILYIIELTSILGEEFVSQNLPFDPGAYYEITLPVLRIITSAGILYCLWLMLLDVLDVHSTTLGLVPVVAFAALSVLVVVAFPYGAMRQWVFYTLRQVFIALGLGFAFWKWRSSTDQHYRSRLEKHRANFLILCALLVLIVVEDTWIILIAPIPDGGSSWLSLYLSSRNISENLMMLFVAYHSIRKSLETLALRFSAPPTADVAEGEEAADLARHIFEELPTYVKKHGLSMREGEVLALVLEGLDNRHIGQTLYLSEGTIKTHVHNIMRKVGVSSREELRQSFWAS